MRRKTVLAIELGGESGRVIRLDFDGSRFFLEEIHRFPNIPVEVTGTLYWDVLSLWNEIQIGIAKSPTADSVGIDSWGGRFCAHRRESERSGLIKLMKMSLSLRFNNFECLLMK